ncbi:hypothetical protein HJG60_009848 [Phyllostomus discolor]|uniref:Uncharacterized protein n=1 Tax=Phyllostomus discolor TaxID=89673 RepID=A0A834BA52_9CHIR|nr:hypothetical protein HJG60_009848 [Phyllostomus discolor]
MWKEGSLAGGKQWEFLQKMLDLSGRRQESQASSSGVRFIVPPLGGLKMGMHRMEVCLFLGPHKRLLYSLYIIRILLESLWEDSSLHCNLVLQRRGVVGPGSGAEPLSERASHRGMCRSGHF